MSRSYTPLPPSASMACSGTAVGLESVIEYKLYRGLSGNILRLGAVLIGAAVSITPFIRVLIIYNKEVV
jgi:hypothetical protein